MPAEIDLNNLEAILAGGVWHRPLPGTHVAVEVVIWPARGRVVCYRLRTDDGEVTIPVDIAAAFMTAASDAPRRPAMASVAV